MQVQWWVGGWMGVWMGGWTSQKIKPSLVRLDRVWQKIGNILMSSSKSWFPELSKLGGWILVCHLTLLATGGVDSTPPSGILEFLLILLIAFPDTGWLFLYINLLDLGTNKFEILLGGTTFLALQKYWNFLKIGLEKLTQFSIADSFDTNKIRMFAKNLSS